jgi:hypothetical protein
VRDAEDHRGQEGEEEAHRRECRNERRELLQPPGSADHRACAHRDHPTTYRPPGERREWRRS